jgi:hypothetical protein
VEITQAGVENSRFAEKSSKMPKPPFIGSNNQRATSSEFPRSGGDLAASTECPTETVTVARVLVN